MGEPVKQVKANADEQLILPDSLERTVKNYKAAQYGYQFDDRDKVYIEYNTLREKVPDTEEVTVKKMIRLFDRDTEKEHLIYYQSSRVKDFNNNYQSCPIVELIGVVPRPVSNVSNDPQNRITDISIIETQNDYYIPYSQDKVIELFENSKERHKIVCYAGYTRPTRIKVSDLIDGKKIIWNQDRFVNADFNELMDKDDDTQRILDTKKSYVIPNKIRNVNGGTEDKKVTSKRVESLAELAKGLDFSAKKEDDDKEQSHQTELISDNKNDSNMINTDEEYKELQQNSLKKSKK